MHYARTHASCPVSIVAGVSGRAQGMIDGQKTSLDRRKLTELLSGELGRTLNSPQRSGLLGS